MNNNCSDTFNFSEILTDRPTDRLTNTRTWWLIGEFLFCWHKSLTERPRVCFLLSANAAFSLFSTFFRSVRPLQLFSRSTFFCRIFNFRTKGITNYGDEIYNNYKHCDTHDTSIKVLIKSYGFFCNFFLVYINFLHWVSISNSALWNIDSVWLFYLFIYLFI